MNNIIKQSPILKVITAQQLSLLIGTKQYCERLKTEIEELRASTEKESQDLRKQLEDNAKIRLEELSNQLSSENDNNLRQVIEHLEVELYTLFHKIIDKLQIKQFNNQQLSNIIKNELYELIKNKQVTLICHPDNLEYLKHDLDGFNIDISYQTDENMIVEQCILKSDLAFIYIDIAECRSKILELFAKNSDKTYAGESFE